jgi:hypothetical protein
MAFDSSLMQEGITSHNAIQARNALQFIFPDVPIPAIVIFDFPTINAIADEIKHERGVAPQLEQRPPTVTRRKRALVRGPQNGDVEGVNAVALTDGSNRVYNLLVPACNYTVKG